MRYTTTGMIKNYNPLFMRQSRLNSINRMPILLYLHNWFAFLHFSRSPFAAERGVARSRNATNTVRFGNRAKGFRAFGPSAVREQKPPHLPVRVPSCIQDAEMSAILSFGAFSPFQSEINARPPGKTGNWMARSNALPIGHKCDGLAHQSDYIINRTIYKS